LVLLLLLLLLFIVSGPSIIIVGPIGQRTVAIVDGPWTDGGLDGRQRTDSEGRADGQRMTDNETDSQRTDGMTDNSNGQTDQPVDELCSS
jgi:hypothetical protein